MNANLKQIAKRLMKWGLVALALYISYFIWVMKPSGEPRKCEHYTELLFDPADGLKIYNGREYRVTICAYGRYGWTDDEKIGIRVYDNSTHELLAMRFFWFGNVDSADYSIFVAAKQNYLRYYSKAGEEQIIEMPPTWWDWIYARLP